MAEPQPIWPPRTFERIFTVFLVLIGLTVFFYLLGWVVLFLAIFLVGAALWLAGKMLWDAFFGR